VTAQIIPFPRHRCDCRLCRTIVEVWCDAFGPMQLSLDEFLTENRRWLRLTDAPAAALAKIAEQGSPLARRVAETVLRKAELLVALAALLPDDGDGGSDAA
jgi:hypothetical protein